jgi:hypothetical protein
MEKQTKILLGVGVAGLVGYALWRNYGVKPKDVVILASYDGDSSKETTNEQKELIQKIAQIRKQFSVIPEHTDMPKKLETSFGKYSYVTNGDYWTKYAEVWGNFATKEKKLFWNREAHVSFWKKLFKIK